MSAKKGFQTNDYVQQNLDLLEKIFGVENMEKTSVQLWDGTLWPDNTSREAVIVLNHPGALRTMFVSGGELGLAEAYLHDDFDINGDIEVVFSLTDMLYHKMLSRRWKVEAARDLLRLPAVEKRQAQGRGRAKLSGKRHSIERDSRAIAFHYDVSNDFYALWLDPRLIYSCAYFEDAAESLETAQKRKLDYICRKLRLQQGQRLLDIGCGWGGLAIFAAKHYGVDVTGITLSQSQVEFANDRISEAGLSERCRVVYQDYREVSEAVEFDALVSVGMFEHVGAEILPLYFSKAWKLLKPGGVFLNHGIAKSAKDKSSFSDAYVFPDGELVPINVTLGAAEGSGFEVRDVESLREHYALTLRHWVRRLEEQHEKVLQIVDETLYRVWRLYMSSSAFGFSSSKLNVYQALLVKPDEKGRSGLPLTRRDWYQK